jgi:hypothetical protein
MDVMPPFLPPSQKRVLGTVGDLIYASGPQAQSIWAILAKATLSRDICGYQQPVNRIAGRGCLALATEIERVMLFVGEQGLMILITPW